MECSGLVYAQFDNGVARRMVGNHVQAGENPDRVEPLESAYTDYRNGHCFI
jgi:hypothetical protein